MTSYFSAIAVLLMVLSPLFVPVAVTVAPLASAGASAASARAFRLRGHAMPIEFTSLQRETLTAIVDTFVASVPREDDPDGFYAATGSDVGADAAIEQYLLAHLPEEQLAGMLQLIDGLGLFEFKDQPQAGREEILANVAGISPEAAGAIAALRQMSVLFAYSLPGPDGHSPLWAGMEYPGPAQNPPQDSRKTLEVITICGDTTFEADVVVVGSGSGGGVAAAALAEAGKRVIILEAGSYYNETDFVQSELAAYQNLFLRGGFFPSADGMVSIAAGSTVGGGSTVNWSNSLLTPDTVRACWANAGLTDVDTPAFDEHLQAVFERIGCNDKVATQNGPHERLSDGASKLGYNYRVATLNIDPEKYDPNLIGYSGMGDQTGAKQGTMRTFLQDASDAGAKLLPNVWVDRILTENGAAVGVEATYTDPRTQQTSRVVINAPSVVAAAGSLETPGLLLRSRIGGPAVGTELRLHPASLVSGVYDEPQDPWFGPAMAGIMNEFAETEQGFGYHHRMRTAPARSVHHRRPVVRRRAAQGPHPQVPLPRRLGVHRQGSRRRKRHPRRERPVHLLVSIHRRARPSPFPRSRCDVDPHARGGRCAADLPGRPAVRSVESWRGPRGLHREGQRDPDRPWRYPGVQCAPDVQRKARQRPGDVRRETDRRAARRHRCLDRRCQWNAELLGGQSDGVDDGPCPSHRDEHARLIRSSAHAVRNIAAALGNSAPEFPFSSSRIGG